MNRPSTDRAFDTAFVRSAFPALATPWALFDNAGGSAPVLRVIDRLAEHMSRLPVQLGATYELSVAARAAVDEGRRAAARLLGADPSEVIFGSSSTQLIVLLARALRPQWNAGDEVVVTDLDHEANVGPWRALEADGIVVREWRLRRETGELALEDLEALLNPRTRLVAFTHCSNIVGTIVDAAAIAQRVRAAGALSCVDGVAYAPHRRVDVNALGVDFYFASLYKVYGPHLAVLFGRRELLEAARGQNHFFVGEEQVPVKFEPGNVAYELAASVPGILDYLDELEAYHAGHEAPTSDERLERAFARIARREAELVQPLLDFLEGHPRVRLIGRSSSAPDERVSTVSFVVEGLRSSEIPARLEAWRLAVRCGHFYAIRAIQSLGLATDEGVVRVSLLHYNTEDEVRRLIEALEEILAAGAGGYGTATSASEAASPP